MKILKDQTFWLGGMSAFAIVFFALFVGVATNRVAVNADGKAMAAVPTPTQPTIPTAQPPAQQAPPEIAIAEVSSADHIKGAADAKITLVEYSSFTCPYCGRVRATLDEVLAEYPDDVRVVYRHFDRGGPDVEAATATECAGEQGKFWEMHDMIFDEGVSNFDDYAADLGLDTAAWSTCAESGKYDDLVQSQTAEAIASGISGTPGFVVNEEVLIPGAVPFSSFQEVIEAQLEA